jgi:hypothetical protein
LNQWQNTANGIHYSSGRVGIGTSNPVSKLNILGDESGDVPSGTPDPRRFFHIKNTSNSSSAVAYMTLEAGPNSNYTAFSHHSSSYSIGELADFGQVLSSGKGLVLRTFPTNNNGTNGVIKFMTGINADGSNSIERMRISANGNIGIGTSSPGFKLTLQGDESGVYDGSFDPRSFINVRNTSSGQYATANTQLFCGSTTFTKLEHVSPNYFIGDFADHGQVWASGKGLILRASPTSSNDATATSIKFMTGFRADGGSNERMRITVDGNIGIGNSDPKAKLEVKDGDVYVNDSTKGIILKSPNGSCWRVTIDNTGNFVRTAITCPN